MANRNDREMRRRDVDGLKGILIGIMIAVPCWTVLGGMIRAAF